MRYVTEAEVGAVLTPALAREAVEQSLLRLADGGVDNRMRIRLALPDGDFAVMPCVDRGLGFAGLKTYAWAPAGTPFLVVLFTLDGVLAGIVEADRLGRLRTAAASAVAAARLARPDASTLGVFGSGRQAAAHVAALREVLPALERVVVHGRDAGRAAAFCAAHGCVPGAAAEAAGCDVVVTATTASTPVLAGAQLSAGALVCAVGANAPELRELDDEVIRRAAFVCTDSREQAGEEAGDLCDPVSRGLLEWSAVVELPDVVAGRERGRVGDDDIVVFKSNGLAAWDLAVAARVLELVEG